MKVKFNVEVEAKRFRQAAVMLDLDIPTDEEIQKWCETEHVVSDKLMGDDSNDMRVFFAMVVLYSQMPDELVEKPRKSSFQEKLEKARDLQTKKR